MEPSAEAFSKTPFPGGFFTSMLQLFCIFKEKGFKGKGLSHNCLQLGLKGNTHSWQNFSEQTDFGRISAVIWFSSWLICLLCFKLANLKEKTRAIQVRDENIPTDRGHLIQALLGLPYPL